jgi:N6-adenosine-specific RNA methylase IME4
MSLKEWWTPEGLMLPPGLTYAEWEEVGAQLQEMEKGIQWVLGEWFLYGERAYGESAAQALPTGYALSTIRASAWVAKRFPQGMREPGVPFAHHREVAALPPDTARALLKRAKAENLTSGDLRNEVHAERSKRAQEVTRQHQASIPPEERKTWPVLIADAPWEHMDTDDICDVTVPAAPLCALFLWVPHDKLPDGLSVLGAWQMTYRSCLIWPSAEENSDYNGLWVKGEHEFILYATRGEFTPAFKPGTMLEPGAGYGPAGPLHSHLDQLVERMYPKLERYQVFAKEAVYGV